MHGNIVNFYGMLNFRCKWNDKTCNIIKDFKTTLTDLGVCYTFNYDHPPLSVKEPGDIIEFPKF